MKDSIVPADVGISRRRFLATAAAGSAVALPAGGLAAIDDHPFSDRQQLDACLDELKAILARIHPDHRSVDVEYIAHPAGGATIRIEAWHQPAVWDGSAYYEVVRDRRKGNSEIYWIDRLWREDDQGFGLYGALLFGGRHVGPRELIDPRRLIRKLEERPS